MEITGKQSIGGPSTKLGFDKSKVTCFRCKQKGHFKRECKNSEVDETEKPFNDDYYRKAIYHHSKEEPKMIENNPKEKSRACAVIHDDEGMEIMQEEYENAVRNKRWDKKRECYVNRDGEPVVHRRDIVHDDVLLVIPRSGEYYSNVEKDKTYVKRLDKIIGDAMTSSLRKRDEERMKKNVDEMVNDLKKVAEEVKVEVVKVEDVKIEEEDKVIKEVVEEKAATEEHDAGDEKKKDDDQTQTDAEENTEVLITESLY
ncbi:uncharacterized protein LOC110931909 [Helianthus annuus]|uniref:uncharacterized protein LOC110931909 n=1 Tax=Helianthus annuus TaxID=4232 RepID=UPI000B90907A|nr:uncharacterized protein LOC110931909 [Helianthus annuus]